MANGHADAWQYPLGMVSDEAALVVSRDNARIASEAIVLKAAMSAVISDAGGKHFNELVDSLMGD
jgi:hypothetical protein